MGTDVLLTAGEIQSQEIEVQNKQSRMGIYLPLVSYRDWET